MKKYVIKRDEGSLPEKLTRYREELNSEQFRVVTAKPQAALVVAGAGTGKTRTITYRVAYLIEQGVSPQRILLATFTNRAAREMLRRVETLTGSQNVHRVWGGTFHRVANLILRRHAASIGYDSNYSILDAEDAKDFVNVCIDEAGIDTKAKRFPKAEVVQDIISYANNTDKPIEDVVIRRYPYFEMLSQQIKRVDYIFQERKRARNVMDYDDLLLNWKRLLIEKPEIADLYAEQFQHILVDEYQDTNKLQAEIIDLLAVKHRNVMVVGDDAQSIFAWRGAEFTNIYEFPDRYTEAVTYKLETNYRSTPEILGLANTSIACNQKQFPKMLQAVKKSKDFKPALVPCSNVEQQSAFVASRILELRAVLEKVVVADPVRDFAVRLVLATHPQATESGDSVRRFVKWGASPRAVQALIRAARVRALADGRAHVAFEDVRHFAPEVLGHRVLLNYDGLAESLSVPGLVDEVAKLVPEEAAA